LCGAWEGRRVEGSEERERGGEERERGGEDRGLIKREMSDPSSCSEH